MRLNSPAIVILLSVGLLADPNWTQAQQAADPGKSENLSPTAVTVNFKNEHAAAVDIIWVDHSGNERAYGSLNSGQSRDQQTGHGHLWRFKQGGQVIAFYQATQQANQTYAVAAEEPESEMNHSLTGLWKDKDGHEIDIQQAGNEVTATAKPEALRRWWDAGRGQIEGNRLTMTHLKAGATTAREIGTLAENGSRINWDNGTHWLRQNMSEEIVNDKEVPFVLPANPHPTADWMGAGYLKLKDKPLNQVVMPGTHNSGTYDLTSYGVGDTFDDIAPDMIKEGGQKLDFAKAAIGLGNASPAGGPLLAALSLLSSEAISKTFHDWAECQERTIIQQLNDGIRSLDMRVCTDKNGTLRICHGEFGPTVETLLGDVKTFVTQHPTEIVIVRFTHFYPSTGDSEQTLHQKLKNTIDLKLKNHIVPNTVDPTSTMDDIWKSAGRVIILYDEFSENDYWKVDIDGSYQKTRGTWHRSNFETKTLEFLNSVKDSPTGFSLLSLEITTDSDLIIRGLDPLSSYPGTLKNLAAKVNPVVLDWIKKKWATRKFNIIQADYYNSTCLVNLCKHLNGLPVASVLGIDPLTTHDTDWGNWKWGYELAGEWFKQAGLDAVNWVGEAGTDAVNWIEQAATDAVNWAEVLVNGEKVADPKRGTTAANVPEGVRHYVITQFHMTNLSSGDDGDGDIEVFGSVNAIPSGSFYTNGDSNQFLFNKRAGDRVILKDGKSHSVTERKDFYILEEQITKASSKTIKYLFGETSVRVPGSHVKIVSRLVEHDDFDNDHMYREDVQDLSELPVGYYKEFKLDVKGEEGEKAQVYYAVSRVK